MDLLEAALKGRVFFNVLSVLVKRRCADAPEFSSAQFPQNTGPEKRASTLVFSLRRTRKQSAGERRPCQHGFEEIRGVHCALGPRGARPDEHVDFVDKENDVSLRLFRFKQHSLETLFKFAAKLGPRNESPQIQGNNSAAQSRRHVSLDDAPRESLHDGRFSHPYA